MNENAKKWNKALMSGEYKQSKYELGGPSCGYCCLGVACAVYEKETGLNLPKNVNGIYILPTLEYDFSVVQNWLGLKSPTGSFFTGEGNCMSLSALNDDGSSFEEIANIIESEPKGLFYE